MRIIVSHRKRQAGGFAAIARIGLLAGASLLASTAARAQSPAPTTPAAATPPPTLPSVLPSAPGLRVGIAQIAVVGGNSAGARERALDEALRQTVDQALGDILDAPARAAQARAIRTLMARARSYVKRYRTLEEGEAGGTYNIRIEAEVDEPALRRATERWSASASPPVGAVKPVALSLLVVGSGAPETGPSVVAALGAAGISAQLGDPSLADPGRALPAAARGGLGAVAFVSASVTDEGAVRGPGKEAISCHLTARLLSVPGGQIIAEQNALPRIFADRPAAGRAECVARAATELAQRLLPLAAASTSAGADLRALTVDAAVTEPAAVPALLKALRGLGTVSAAELRRLSAGHAEIRVQTRLAGPALVTALSRESATTLDLTGVEAGSDTIRLQARLRPGMPSPSPTPTGVGAAPGATATP
ncbi:MAG: hypothetical protein QOI66_1051 [Myxococcales bacterium]|jgi:hypothetical protein|nr:hypothetical protein [Myxococcales bacterium]